MLHRLAVATMSLCIAGSVASAQIDYTEPHIEIEVTAAQIAAFTGQSEKVDLAALGIDTQGRLYTYTANKRSGVDAAIGTQEDAPALVRIDVSGGAPVFTTIATYQQLKAACDLGDGAPENAMYFNAIEVANGTAGNIYVSQTRGTDDIIAISPGAAPPATTTLTKMRQQEGVSSMILNNAQTAVVVGFVDNLGAVADAMVTLPANNVGPWPPTVLLDQPTVTTHTGAIDYGVSTFVQLSTNSYYLWDEAGHGGSDQVLSFTPGAINPVDTQLKLADVGQDATGEGLTAMARGFNDAVFAWSEFPSAAPFPASEGMYIYPDPMAVAGRVTLHDTTINSETGLAGNREVAIGGIKVRNLVEQNAQIVYLADNGGTAAGVDTILSVGYAPGTPTLNGDVNDDGVVNVIDVTELNLLLDGIIGSVAGDADADNDGDVDLADEQELIDFIVDGVALAP